MLTPAVLILLTALGLAGSVMALRRLRPGHAANGRGGKRLHTLVGTVAITTSALFMYRWGRLGTGWNPLEAHVDGLTLIAALLAATLWYIQTRPRLIGLAAFGLPVLSFVLLWAVCASLWTYRPFRLDTLHPVWRAVHLAGVYLGTLGATVAAAAGAMYLYAERRLKRKTAVVLATTGGHRTTGGGVVSGGGRLASLEALERVIQQSSALGFALLTLGLISGVIVLVEESSVLGPGGWYGPKVALAVLAWVVYALLMNVRYATTFRGRRAAWLAIGGLVLLLTVYGLVVSGRGHGDGAEKSGSVVLTGANSSPSPSPSAKSEYEKRGGG